MTGIRPLLFLGLVCAGGVAGGADNSAASLIARAHAALGHAGGLSSVKSFAATGEMRRAGAGTPKESKVELRILRPDRLLRKEQWTLGKSGAQITWLVGYDGESAWTSTAATQGMMVKVREDEPYRRQLAVQLYRDLRAYVLALFGDLDPAFAYTYAGEAELPDGDAVALDFSEAGFKIRLFLDKTTFRPVMVSYQNNEPGTEPNPVKEVQLYVSDHRVVDGIQIPHHFRKVVNGELAEEISVFKFTLNSLQPGDFSR